MLSAKVAEVPGETFTRREIWTYFQGVSLHF